jgi:hypothetical protein
MSPCKHDCKVGYGARVKNCETQATLNFEYKNWNDDSDKEQIVRYDGCESRESKKFAK